MSQKETSGLRAFLPLIRFYFKKSVTNIDDFAKYYCEIEFLSYLKQIDLNVNGKQR